MGKASYAPGRSPVTLVVEGHPLQGRSLQDLNITTSTRQQSTTGLPLGEVGLFGVGGIVATRSTVIEKAESGCPNGATPPRAPDHFMGAGLPGVPVEVLSSKSA